MQEVSGVGGAIAGSMVGTAIGELFKNDEMESSNFDEEELLRLLA